MSEEGTWLSNFSPVTLASITGNVKRAGHTVKLVDCIESTIDLPHLTRVFMEFRPDWVVVNTSTPTISSDLQVVVSMKKIIPKSIVYGVHPTALWEELLQKTGEVDYVIRGEPETPILRDLSGETRTTGVAFRDFDEGIYRESDLDNLVPPAYELLLTYRFPLTMQPWMFLIDGRGCPWSCIYCVEPMMSGRQVRYHSPSYMLSEIKHVVRAD